MFVPYAFPEGHMATQYLHRCCSIDVTLLLYVDLYSVCYVCSRMVASEMNC
jgi:hypothetical protein